MIKKTLILTLASLMSIGHAMASDLLTVSDVSLPQGGEAVVEICCSFETQFKGYQLDVVLDDGISLVLNNSGLPYGENGFSGTDHSISSSNPSNGKYRFIVTSNSGQLLPNSGSLLIFKVIGTGSETIGKTFNGTITASEFTASSNTAQNLPDVNFSISIVENRVLLDETSTSVPQAATGVNIQVKRTIPANEWSTICLPFAMSEAQVKAAFGDDVQLGDFTGYDITNDGGNITGIEMKFDKSITAIEANHPYIIKVSTPITEFTVDGVTIDPDDEPCVEQDNGLTGRKRVVYSGFYGNYIAGFSLAEMADDFPLFLSGNKLWYATSVTQSMKAFRGYFWLTDVLSEVEGANARIIMSFDDDNTTGITNICGETDSQYYNLQGLPVEAPAKGMYIHNGKVVIVKQ